jgi:hypothetical protein
MLVRMSEPVPGVALREVVGDPEELAALQRVMESDEGFALRVKVRPWRYDKLRSEAVMMDKVVPARRSPSSSR